MFEVTQTAERGHCQGGAGNSAWRPLLWDVYRFVAKSEPVPVSPLAVSTPTVQATAPGRKPHGGRPSVDLQSFTNRSTERADEAFAGGMCKDIADALSLGRGLKVISLGATAAHRKNTSDLRLIVQVPGATYMPEATPVEPGA